MMETHAEVAKVAGNIVRDAVIRRAKAAERARWEFDHGRFASDGDYIGSGPTMTAGWVVRTEAVLDAYLDDFAWTFASPEAADSIIAETRAATRAELDGKWLALPIAEVESEVKEGES